MIATMPTAVVAVMPTPVTIVAAAVTATMPAPGVSLARHRQARERDCHAADQARKFQRAIYLTQPTQDVVVYGVRGVSTHFG